MSKFITGLTVVLKWATLAFVVYAGFMSLMILLLNNGFPKGYDRFDTLFFYLGLASVGAGGVYACWLIGHERQTAKKS